MENTFVNLTPHTITVFLRDRQVDLPPSGRVLRLREKEAVVQRAAGIPLVRKEFELEGIEDFPPKWVREGDCYCEIFPPKRAGEVQVCWCGGGALIPILYVVPLVVLQEIQRRFPNRRDFIAPNTGAGELGAVREDGVIKGVRSFVTI